MIRIANIKTVVFWGKNMTKVLVVGGSGYVGGHLVDLLQDSNHEVTVFDSLLYEDRYLKRVKFIHGDIRETKKLLELSKDYDCVVWLAALVGDPLCALNEKVTREINTKAPVEFRKEYNGRFIFMSTCSVYGAQDGLLTETSSKSPLSLYAITKLDTEMGLSEIGKDDLIFRLGTLFGISDTHSRLRADLVLNVLVIRAVYAKLLTVFGGDQYRPLLHVKDVGGAIFNEIDTGLSGIFNLHCENITIVELAKQIKSFIPDVILEISESSFQDSRNYSVSSEKYLEASSFRPEYNISDGILELQNSLKSGRFPNILSADYINVDKMRDILKDRIRPTTIDYWKG